jgi:hypothetical protein
MEHTYEYSLYIYSKGELEGGRDEIEDEIEESLGDIVEVSGGGSGAFGWNVDVELLEPTKLEYALAQLPASDRHQRLTPGWTRRGPRLVV